MAHSLPILRKLTPQSQRVGLVAPVDRQSFWPGQSWYEWLLSDHRRNPKVDLFGLVVPFGIVEERCIIETPEIYGSHLFGPSDATEETALRLGAWADLATPRYGRLVVLAHGPTMPIWSRVMEGHPLTSRVRLVPVPRVSRSPHSAVRWRDSILKRNINREIGT